MNYMDQNRRREPLDAGRETNDPSWGNILYRAGVALAVLIAVLAVGNYFYNIGQNRPLLPVVPLLVAGVIWLVGYGLRYLFSNR